MGLLGGMLLGAAAGGAKGYADTFTEQVKQEALAARDANMLRIQRMFAQKDRQETREFTVAQDTANFERGITQRKTEADIAEGKEAARYAERREDAATLYEQKTTAEQKEYDRRVAREEKVYGRREGEDEIKYQRRRKEIVDDAIRLAEERPSDLQKNYNTMKNILGEDEATKMFKLSLTKESTAEDRVKLNAASALTTAMLRSGEYTPEQARTIFRENMAEVGLSLAQKDVRPGGEFDLQSLLKLLDPTVSQATKKAVLPEKGGGIIENQMETTSNPKMPDSSYFQREYDERMKQKRKEEYEANLPVRPTGTSTLGRR